MKSLARACLILLVLPVCAGADTGDAPHPLSPWVRADVLALGPGVWMLAIRQGGYYSGTTADLRGQFEGQLSAEQRHELARLLARLPREERVYRFGRDPMEGPSLDLQLQYPWPSTRYIVGLLTEADRKREHFAAVSEVAEFLVRLIPPSAEQPATPWRPLSKHEAVEQRVEADER